MAFWLSARGPLVAAAAGLTLCGWAAPAAADVTSVSSSGFVSRHEVVVKVSPKAVWLALISPASWWRSEHTWSGDAKNLTLMPKAGGCFCETIPEVDEPGRFTLEGSVEHMRVVQAYPEQALRMVGSLGPLQSEPVIGVLTIALTEVANGTRIVWEYNVGGTMRYDIAVISKAVDGVMGAQLAALAQPLGVVTPASPAPLPPTEGALSAKGAQKTVPALTAEPAKPAEEPMLKVAPSATPANSRVPGATKPPMPADKTPGPPLAPKLEPKSPSFADTFGDLDNKPPR